MKQSKSFDLSNADEFYRQRHYGNNIILSRYQVKWWMSADSLLKPSFLTCFHFSIRTLSVCILFSLYTPHQALTINILSSPDVTYPRPRSSFHSNYVNLCILLMLLLDFELFELFCSYAKYIEWYIPYSLHIVHCSLVKRLISTNRCAFYDIIYAKVHWFTSITKPNIALLFSISSQFPPLRLSISVIATFANWR